MPIYADIYDGPPRSFSGRTEKHWITIHCTQNTASARGEAGFAKRRTDGTSSHHYVDDRELIQSLDTDLSAHHVGSTIGNLGGISYEITGLIQWSRARWLSSVAWDRLGAQIARDCAHHDIPVRLLTVAQIQAGDGGIMTHDQARLAWGGTDHTDPGPNFPMDHLVSEVRRAMGDDDVSWTERIELPGWQRDRWPGDPEDGWRAEQWLRMAGGHARAGREELAEVRAGQAAILARLDGGTEADAAQAIRAALAEHRAEMLAQLRAELADLLGQRAELGADAVLDALADRLSDTPE